MFRLNIHFIAYTIQNYKSIINISSLYHLIQMTQNKIILTYSPNLLAITLKQPPLLYQIQLTNMDQGKGLSDWFDGLEDVYNHLKGDDKNYQIGQDGNKAEHKQNTANDNPQKFITILGAHPTKPNARMQICTIKFQVKNELMGEKDEDYWKGERKNLQDMASRIEQSQLSNSQVRILLTSLIASNLSLISKLPKQPSQFSGKFRQTNSKLLQQQETEYKNQNATANKRDNKSAVMKKEEIENMSKIQQLEQVVKNKDQTLSAVINKMNRYFQDTDLRMEKMQDRIQMLEKKFTDFLTKPEPPPASEPADLFIDKNCYSYRRIIVQGKTITKCKDQQADIFSKIKISQKNSFSIIFRQIQGNVCIGVADSALKHRQSFVNQRNCVAFYNDGNFYNGIGLKGRMFKGFKNGDVILVKVRLPEGLIEWRVNGQLRLSYDYDRLKNREIQWVPYIWMTENGTSFTIVE